MKYLSALFLIALNLSCNNYQSLNQSAVQSNDTKEQLFVEARLVASFINYVNPRDTKIYYLVDIKLINNTPQDFEFYSLSCGSLVNIVSDTQQADFLYHNCSNDFAITVKLAPQQVYTVPVILVSGKFNNMTTPSVRFGFIVDPPQKRFGRKVPMDNQEIISELKLMRQNSENVIWSKPVMLSSNSNSNPYEIRSSLGE